MNQLNELSKQFTEISGKINQGQGTIGRFVNDEAFYNNLNSTVRDVQRGHPPDSVGPRLGRPVRQRPGALQQPQRPSASRSRPSPTTSAPGAARPASCSPTTPSTTRRAGPSPASTARWTASTSSSTTSAQGRGTAGKLLTDEAIYNDARAAIARFNTAAERIDNVVAGVQRGEGTAGKLLTDDQLYNNVNQLSAESVKLIYDFRQNPKKYLTIKFELF